MSEPSAPLPTQQNPGNKAAKHRLNVCNLFGATTHSTRRLPPALEIWHFGTFAVPGYDGPAHLVNKLQQKALRTVLLLLLQTTATSEAALFPRGTFCHFYASILERVDRRLGRSSRRRRCCCHGNAYETHVFWDAFSRFSQTHTHTNTRRNMVEKSR